MEHSPNAFNTSGEPLKEVYDLIHLRWQTSADPEPKSKQTRRPRVFAKALFAEGFTEEQVYAAIQQKQNRLQIVQQKKDTVVQVMKEYVLYSVPLEQ